MRVFWSLLLVCLFAILASRAAQAQVDLNVQLGQVNVAAYPTVSLYVNVTDREGKLVAGLKQEDFQVTEGGTSVTLTDFAGIESARPVDIVFVLDTTGSMRAEIDGVKNTILTFADKLREKNRSFRLGLVTFGDEIREVGRPDGQLTDSADEFKGWVGRQRADGGGDDAEISLDAIARAMSLQYRREAQRILILITDAPPHQRGDGITFSRVIAADVTRQARDQSFTVYSVTPNLPHFRTLADETSGQFYDLARRSDFTTILDRIGGIIASQYRLTYVSPRPTYDGTRRDIRVQVKSGEGGGSYVEEHLVQIRSHPLLFVILLLPLLALLAAPTLLQRWPRRPKEGSTRQPPPPPVIPVPPPQPQTFLIVQWAIGGSGAQLGSAPDSDVALAGLGARHAVIERDGPRYVVADLSGGQTRVSYSGDPATLRQTPRNALKDGSLLQLGAHTLRFRLNDQAVAWLEEVIPLPNGPVTVGAAPDNTVVVLGNGVAPRHARLAWDNGRWIIHDAGSAGGTWVSFLGDPSAFRQVQVNALKDGSVIRLGNASLVLRVE